MDLDPDPYKIITDPDPGGPKTSGSGTLNPDADFFTIQWIQPSFLACVLLISEKPPSAIQNAFEKYATLELFPASVLLTNVQHNIYCKSVFLCFNI